MKCFLAIKVLCIIDLVGALARGLAPGGYWFAGPFIITSILSALIPIFEAIRQCIPFCCCLIPPGVFKAVVGVGIGMVVSRTTTAYLLILSSGKGEQGIFFRLCFEFYAFGTWWHLVRAVMISLTDSKELKILGLSCKGGMSPAPFGGLADDAGPTLNGIMFFFICVSTRVYFVWGICCIIMND